MPARPTLHLSRRAVLWQFGAAGLLAPLASARAATAAKRLVVVIADGGWDVTFAFDPRDGREAVEGPEVFEDPDDPNDAEEVETFGVDLRIATNRARRPEVGRFFAQWADRAAVVNGILVGSIAHDPCMYRILTGTTSSRNPDVATIVGSVHGAGLPLGSLDTGGRSLAGQLGATAGRLGARSQLGMLLDPALSLPAADGVASPRFVADPVEAGLLDGYLRDRAAAFAAGRADAAGSAKLADLGASQERARKLGEAAPVFLDHLQVGVPPSSEAMIGLMVDLFQRDLCRTVTLDSGSGWDTHTDSIDQHGNFDRLFRDLSLLMTRLDQAALLDDTLVVVVSEMTRTPRYNAVGGKDHWPHTSALLLGSGVRGGRTLGATDALLESVPVDFTTGEPAAGGEVCRYDHFVAGLLAMLDVDPGAWLPGVRPYTAMGA